MPRICRIKLRYYYIVNNEYFNGALYDYLQPINSNTQFQSKVKSVSSESFYKWKRARRVLSACHPFLSDCVQNNKSGTSTNFYPPVYLSTHCSFPYERINRAIGRPDSADTPVFPNK